MKRIFGILVLVAVIAIGCGQIPQQTSDSGVSKASVKISVDEKGRTSEQNNIIEKNLRDAELGSIKHLYIVSAYTGDVLEYYTVKGKVTSGGKRLSPRYIIGTTGKVYDGFSVYINGERYITDECMDEYGTYGESSNYLYWFDAQDNYHQYFPTGGTYLHISDKPLRVRKGVLTLELQ
jgi:hypothetical protein